MFFFNLVEQTVHLFTNKHDFLTLLNFVLMPKIVTGDGHRAQKFSLEVGDLFSDK